MEKLNLFRGYHYPMEDYIKNQQKGGFTQLSLDLTSRCNYKCDWCFNLDLLGKNPSDLLTLDERKKLLEQSVELGAKTLVFPGTGEPTLDKDFYPLTKLAHELGLTTVVYSNLTGNINPERLRELFERDVSIGIKFDSFKPEHFTQRYHTNKSTYHKFMNNLDILAEIYGGSEDKIPQGTVHRAILNTVLTLENKSELKELIEKSYQMGFPHFLRPIKPVTWAENNPSAWQQLGNLEGHLIPEKELVELAKENNTLFSPSSTLENHCAIYSFGLTVKNNGDIQICPDHHQSRGSYGNIRNTSLKEVMERLNQERIIKTGYCVMLPSIEH